MARIKIDPSKLPQPLPIPSDDVCAVYERKVRHMAKCLDGLIAYTPHLEGAGWGLTIVVNNVIGHYPMPVSFCFGTEAQCDQVAKYLNSERLRLPANLVTKLICQSMRAK
jgi:hypothetical protein